VVDEPALHRSAQIRHHLARGSCVANEPNVTDEWDMQNVGAAAANRFRTVVDAGTRWIAGGSKILKAGFPAKPPRTPVPEDPCKGPLNDKARFVIALCV